MRVALVVDGRSVDVEVDASAGTLVVDGHRLPFKILSDVGAKVELELNGERVAVEGWPSGLPDPPAELSANGERVVVKLTGRGSGPSEPPGSPPAADPRPAGAVPSPAPAGSAEDIVTPMPGKVIEVRVAEGERVKAGQVLLVVEAMKMRNDVVSPRDGVVRDLRVRPGANVRAREPLLRVPPD